MVTMHEITQFYERWRIFVKERFSPLNYILMITFYFGANAVVALAASRTKPVLTSVEIFGALIILSIFFHLRIFDEIKDYEKDLTVHPDRPLARGIIAISEAKKVAVALILMELALGLIIGPPAFLMTCCVIAYSLLMYKEFFVRDWLRPRLATYAFSHTVISCWMSLLIYSVVTNRYFWQVSKEYGMFLIANMMIFNIFEFGRKTFSKEEGKDLVESYSSGLGPVRVAASVFFMASVAVSISFWLGGVFNAPIAFFISMGLLLVLTLLLSILYVYFNTAFWAKAFRSVSSLFILLYTMIITAGFLLNEGFFL